MEATIFAFVRRHSTPEQLKILAMSLASLPVLYLTLDLPKTIINEALSGQGPFALWGHEFDQTDYLFALCALFLALVLLGGLLKYVTNVYVGVVAERMLRRLRYTLYSHVLRFPLPHLRRISQGELVQLINAETEPLGGFVGDALSVPAIQGGTLLTTLAFMFVQDPVLGLAAIALYPLQVWLIPKLQARVNELGKRRVRQVRRNAERISEMAQSVRDIRANDATWWERARFSDELFAVYNLRFEIYKKKFLIKFINNFLAQLGPFFFFSIGGYLVIQGQLTIGALVAVIAAQKDMAAPWRELLTYYQNLWDVRIKYDQIVQQFVLPGLRDPKLQDPQPEQIPHLEGDLRAAALVVRDEDGEPLLDGVSFQLSLPTTLAVVGSSGSGKEELTLILAGLLEPHGGRVTIAGQDLHALPEAVLGRRIGYVANPTAIFAGTIFDNLIYGLRHRPLVDPPPAVKAARARALLEARRSGNAPFDSAAEWTDWAAAGVTTEEERLPRLVELLRVVRLDGDVYAMGLRQAIEPDEALAAALLGARRAMRQLLDADPRLARLVEPFDPQLYNSNATLAENLLFGTPVGATFDLAYIAQQPYVIATLRKAGLLDELRTVGWRIAGTMVELFADLPPEHDYFQQFSFIAPEELPYYRTLVARGDAARLDALPAEDRDRLLALSFKIIPARHRLGLVTEELKDKVLRARELFRRDLPAALAGKIAFLDPDRYNAAASIQDNVLFGKVAYGQAQAVARIAELLGQVLDNEGLRDRVIEVGLRTECGVGGGRLTAAQRQKVALARELLKRPDLLILHDGTGALDSADQIAVRDALLAAAGQRMTLIWALHGDDWADQFAYRLELSRGTARLVPRAIDGHGGSAPLVAAK